MELNFYLSRTVINNTTLFKHYAHVGVCIMDIYTVIWTDGNSIQSLSLRKEVVMK